jgi:hypothetical protein
MIVKVRFNGEMDFVELPIAEVLIEKEYKNDHIYTSESTCSHLFGGEQKKMKGQSLMIYVGKKGLDEI